MSQTLLEDDKLWGTMKPIIAVVGTSGAGKTTLMDRAIEALPHLCDRIQSFTTRPQRNEADGLYYEFITREEFEERKAKGIIVQLVEFAGNITAPIDHTSNPSLKINSGYSLLSNTG